MLAEKRSPEERKEKKEKEKKHVELDYIFDKRQ